MTCEDHEIQGPEPQTRMDQGTRPWEQLSFPAFETAPSSTFVSPYVKNPNMILAAQALDDTRKTRMHDPVNSPSHYTRGKMEVIDFIEDQGLNYHLSSVLKYVCRAGHKGAYPGQTQRDMEIEDLKKAAWYLNRYIQCLEKQR